MAKLLKWDTNEPKMGLAGKVTIIELPDESIIAIEHSLIKPFLRAKGFSHCTTYAVNVPVIYDIAREERGEEQE